MTDSTVELFTKYLAGDADATEIRRLHQVLADDPQAVDALMSEAYMDVEIREALGGSAMEAMLAKVTQEDRLAPVSIAGPWLPSRVMAAALLLVAVSGWGAVAYVVGRLGDARANIDSLKKTALPNSRMHLLRRRMIWVSRLHLEARIVCLTFIKMLPKYIACEGGSWH